MDRIRFCPISDPARDPPSGASGSSIDWIEIPAESSCWPVLQKPIGTSRHNSKNIELPSYTMPSLLVNRSQIHSLVIMPSPSSEIRHYRNKDFMSFGQLSSAGFYCTNWLTVLNSSLPTAYRIPYLANPIFGNPTHFCHILLLPLGLLSSSLSLIHPKTDEAMTLIAPSHEFLRHPLIYLPSMSVY